MQPEGRKRYEFSKAWDVHLAATRFSDFTYNFCWPVRTLRVMGADGRWQSRTPAMAAGLTGHVWSIREWITFPAVQRRQDTPPMLEPRRKVIRRGGSIPL